MRVTLPGASAGALVQTFQADRFHGTGQVATPGGVVGRLRASRAPIQDQGASTQSKITFWLLADDPTNPGKAPRSSPLGCPPTPTPDIEMTIRF